MLFLNLLLQVDTASAGYKAGYMIGSWLPFALVTIMAFIIIWLIRRKRK